MPEIIKNSLTGESVIISESRQNRPKPLFESSFAVCQFCPENSRMTPGAVFSSPSGRVRVVPNLYPILDTSNHNGYGIHEVVIDTDIHTENFHDFSQIHAEEALSAIFGRLPVLYLDKKIKYVQIFKNNGINAGATIGHSHWQILAVPFLPSYQELMLKNALHDFMRTGVCTICRYLEYAPGVYENAGAVAYCPKDAKFGFEINIAPKRHFSSFAEISDKDVSYLSDALLKCAKAISNSVCPDYNICFQGLFFEEVKHSHFFIQLIPRAGRFGGFELSTGSFTHSDPSAKAAALIQKTIANTDVLG